MDLFFPDAIAAGRDAVGAHEHLSEFVTYHLTRVEIVALGQQIARKHGHVLKPPRDRRLAGAWFAGYIAKSLSRPDALKYLKELRRRKEEGDALLRIANT